MIRELLDVYRRLECISVEDEKLYLAGTGAYSRPFIINMEKEKERYTAASTLLLSLGLEPIRFRAIEGSKVQGHPILKLFSKLRPAEQGCLLSHLSIVALAACHPVPDQFTLIFEDDIASSLTGTGLRDNLDRLLPIAKKEGADLIHLGKCYETCAAMKQVSGNIYRTAKPYCAHAIAIRNSYAQSFLSRVGKVGQAIDNLYRLELVEKHVRGLVFHPALFYQDVLTTESALRPKQEQITNYTECLDAQVHPGCPECTVCPTCPSCPVVIPPPKEEKWRTILALSLIVLFFFCILLQKRIRW